MQVVAMQVVAIQVVAIQVVPYRWWPYRWWPYRWCSPPHHGGGQLLRTPMGYGSWANIYRGRPPPTPKQIWGVGQGAYPHPPPPWCPDSSKNGQKCPKLVQKSAKNRPKSKPNLGAMGGGVVPPPPGVQKKRNPGRFLQGKNRNWVKIFRGVRSPPYPHGVQNWPSVPPCTLPFEGSPTRTRYTPHVNFESWAEVRFSSPFGDADVRKNAFGPPSRPQGGV